MKRCGSCQPRSDLNYRPKGVSKKKQKELSRLKAVEAARSESANGAEEKELALQGFLEPDLLPRTGFTGYVLKKSLASDPKLSDLPTDPATARLYACTTLRPAAEKPPEYWYLSQ